MYIYINVFFFCSGEGWSFPGLSPGKKNPSISQHDNNCFFLILIYQVISNGVGNCEPILTAKMKNKTNYNNE